MRGLDQAITRRDKVILLTADEKKFYTLAERDKRGGVAWVYWYFKIGEVRLKSDGTVDSDLDNVSFIKSWRQG